MANITTCDIAYRYNNTKECKNELKILITSTPILCIKILLIK